MAKTNPSAVARTRRKKHTKKTIRGTTARPRLCVFRSDRHIYVQVIDDTLGRTLAQASSMKLEMPEGADGGNVEGARVVGKAIASSYELVWSDCVPPSTAANAWIVTRTTLLSGCWAVSVTPPVCV